MLVKGGSRTSAKDSPIHCSVVHVEIRWGGREEREEREESVHFSACRSFSELYFVLNNCFDMLRGLPTYLAGLYLRSANVQGLARLGRQKMR